MFFFKLLFIIINIINNISYQIKIKSNDILPTIPSYNVFIYTYLISFFFRFITPQYHILLK